MEEETKIETPVEVTPEVVPVEAPVCTNCENSGKDCVVCTDKTVV